MLLDAFMALSRPTVALADGVLIVEVFLGAFFATIALQVRDNKINQLPQLLAPSSAT